MEFVIDGVAHSLDASSVRSALRGVTPEPVREHWVDVDGVRWPPKQVLALATGRDRTSFTSHRALGLLERLGFDTSPWGGSRRSAEPMRVAAPRANERLSVQPEVRARAAAASDADIILVGCSGSKGSGPARAAELFTGAAFQKARALAVRSGKPWYVISAKFGLLHPDETIAPYDVYLPKQSARYRGAWADWVVAQLGERHDLQGLTLEVHAGSAYCEPLIGPLADCGATLTQPLAGLGLGRRLAWYGNSADSADAPAVAAAAAPDVTWLLDERNAVPPGEFLAAGRSAYDQPGLYSWWVDVAGAQALSAGLGHRVPSGLIYAGRAGGIRPNGSSSANTLWGRVATMHLGGNREFSTFRLTLAACLSKPDEPPISEADLTAWMLGHLRVAALPLQQGLVTAGETRLLEIADAPLNLRDVAPTPLRSALKRCRATVRNR